MFRKYHISTLLSTRLVSHPPIRKLGKGGGELLFYDAYKKTVRAPLILQRGFGQKRYDLKLAARKESIEEKEEKRKKV